MNGYASMSNNYGGGYRTETPGMANAGGYYNSYNNTVAAELAKNNASCYFPGPLLSMYIANPLPLPTLWV